jgi:hypothetical protein
MTTSRVALPGWSDEMHVLLLPGGASDSVTAMNTEVVENMECKRKHLLI